MRPSQIFKKYDIESSAVSCMHTPLKVRIMGTENNYWKRKYGYGSNFPSINSLYVSDPLPDSKILESTQVGKSHPILKICNPLDLNEKYVSKNNILTEHTEPGLKETVTFPNLHQNNREICDSKSWKLENSTAQSDNNYKACNLYQSSQKPVCKKKMVQLKLTDMLAAKKAKPNTDYKNFDEGFPSSSSWRNDKSENSLPTLKDSLLPSGTVECDTAENKKKTNDAFEEINEDDIVKIFEAELKAMKALNKIKIKDNRLKNTKSKSKNNSVVKNIQKSKDKKCDSKNKYSLKKSRKNLENHVKICKEISEKKSSKTSPISEHTSISKSLIDFNVKELLEDDIETLENELLEKSLIEIGFTILFSEKFCQMEKVPGTVDKACTPYGLMFLVSSMNKEQKYYYFQIKMSTDLKIYIKKFITNVMSSAVRKICYEAQELIILLIDLFNFNREDVCLKWEIIDPKIGCFLLDPDDPPETFYAILSKLSINVDFKLAMKSHEQRGAFCLHLLSKSCHQMYKKLMENDLWKVFITMETRIITILSTMEMRGICVDTLTLIGMQTVLNNQLLKIEKQAFKAAGKTFMLNSPTQLRIILFDEMKLDTKNKVSVKKTMRLGAKSTSESVLKSLVPLHPLPGLVLNYRSIHKAKATFVDALLHQSKNGVITTLWEQTSAATGRIVCRSPNLQAIPKQPLALELFPQKDFEPQAIQLRNAFIPRPGYTFVAADFQHIECRVFTHFTQDRTLIEIFKHDVDIFSTLAMKWMGKSFIEDVMPEDRFKTKHLVYALMYGAGAQKLAEILNMEVLQASKIISKFLATFPSLKLFKENILKKCRDENGVLRSIFGRVRKFCNINSTDLKQRAYAERQAINFVIQGSAADICKLAMIATEHRLSNLSESLGHHLLLQIHDELMWEVPDNNVETFIEMIQEVMQQSGEFCGKLSVPLPVSIVKGKSWGQMF